MSATTFLKNFTYVHHKQRLGTCLGPCYNGHKRLIDSRFLNPEAIQRKSGTPLHQVKKWDINFRLSVVATNFGGRWCVALLHSPSPLGYPLCLLIFLCIIKKNSCRVLFFLHPPRLKSFFPSWAEVFLCRFAARLRVESSQAIMDPRDLEVSLPSAIQLLR